MLKTSNDNLKNPRAAMREYVRQIAGDAGKTVERNIEIAMRRMNAHGSLGHYAVSYRTVYAYWYAAFDDLSDVSSRHMDRARELVGEQMLIDLIDRNQDIVDAVNDNLARLPSACPGQMMLPFEADIIPIANW